MRLPRKDLQSVLSILSKVVERRPTVPVLEGHGRPV